MSTTTPIPKPEPTIVLGLSSKAARVVYAALVSVEVEDAAMEGTGVCIEDTERIILELRVELDSQLERTAKA
jgi:hypothetical protein